MTGEIVNLTNTPGDDFAMGWISDDVLSVTPLGKKRTQWENTKEMNPCATIETKAVLPTGNAAFVSRSERVINQLAA